MNWFVNLSTRAKLFFSFGLGVLLLIIVIITAVKSISRLENLEKDLVREELANSSDLLTLRSYENEVRVGLLTMMAATDLSGREKWNQIIKERSVQIGEILYSLLERNKNDAEISGRLHELNEVMLSFKQTRDTQIIPLIYEKKIAQARKLILGIQAERYEEDACDYNRSAKTGRR